MSSKPTLFQTLFHQPSQKYALQPTPSTSHPRRSTADNRPTRSQPTRSQPSSQPFPSSSSTPDAPKARPKGPGFQIPTKSVEPGIADISVPRPSQLEHSCEQLRIQEPTSPTPSDTDSDIFYTPLSTPRSSLFMPPSPDPVAPPAQSSSSVSSAEDDLFSWRSATTSATSLSSPSAKPDASTESHRPRRASYHAPARSRPRSGTSVADWSKDVRWLVPPDSMVSSRTSSIAGSLLDLVDVEYDTPSNPKPRIKTGRKARPTESDRMSALMEEEEDDGHPGSVQTAPVQGNPHVHALPARPRTISAPGSPRRPRPASVLSRTSSTSSRTVVLPSPLPVSSGAASSGTGFTSLTLPRAAYAPSKHPGRVSSSVDITRSGLAQTTMSTISITRHAITSGSLRFGRPRSADTPARLRASMPSPLSFASHTPPPNKVHSAQVLVQVWAAALDGLDSLLVNERAGKSDGFGYVPGRSFVGRAVECGWEVNNVSKGDWVFGITDVRKSGALSEFIVVDRRRIHRSPRPSVHFTIDQLALLPLAGVPAHRAVRTFAHLPRGSRALVLHAHSGAGLLATQELTSLGFKVTAQVAGAWGGLEEKRARTAGAKDVRCGSAVEVVKDVKGEEFDGVVDTLGGKEVWDACRRVLRTSGQFTTLVGDVESGIPTANAHFKSNMRSLRRAFVKKDHKSVGYQWVSPAADVDGEGEDVRDSLAAVARLAEDGVYAPFAGRVLPFERAPDAFNIDLETQRSMVSLGGTAVVRIVD